MNEYDGTGKSSPSSNEVTGPQQPRVENHDAVDVPESFVEFGFNDEFPSLEDDWLFDQSADCEMCATTARRARLCHGATVSRYDWEPSSENPK